MTLAELFDVGKPMSIDLSHVLGWTGLVNEYEAIENVVFTHHTLLTSDHDSIDLLYFDYENTKQGEGVLLKSDGEWFFFRLVMSEVMESQEEFDAAIGNLEEETLPFANEEDGWVFKSLSSIWKLNQGDEKVISSLDAEFCGKTLDASYRFYKTEHEYMFANMVEGELSLYVGVQITEGKIL